MFDQGKSVRRTSLAWLALGLATLSTPVSFAQDNSYQSKFKSDDWSDSEIVKPQPTQPKSSKTPSVVRSSDPLDSRASSPNSANFAMSSIGTIGADKDDWPTELPRLSVRVKAKSTAKGPLKVEVSESVSIVAAKVAALKRAPEAKVYEIAKQALADSNYQLAIPLFQMLSARAPRDPRYFYGAGLAQTAYGAPDDAFPNLLMAWHLGDNQVYADAANEITEELRKRMDGTFKLTFQWQRDDPQVVLNAGARLWKLGLTAQAIQLFEYSLQNDPIYRGIAAYNLGAVAEHNGDLKRAVQYYQWALKQRAAIQAAASAHPEMAAEVVSMEKLCPTIYMETALADVQNELHQGEASWNGWPQATSYPQYWASEVCPLCAISRTSIKYEAGQSQLR
ncbi:MAG: tetratricopeptide repeat protein [Candidatus Obscuribacterales bacterium]|nr:tetratricopeptide repeat protein [Candidatus Obscuribacterales bacterium]